VIATVSIGIAGIVAGVDLDGICAATAGRLDLLGIGSDE
jgi:hypothetical protein